MNEVVEIGLWIILSGVKYLFAVLPLLAKSHRPWYWDMLIVSTGGIMGVFSFTYLGAYISNYLSKYHFFKMKYPKLKKFIKIKNSYGLIGIALFSPIAFSIPVGCMISAAFEHNKHKVLSYQIASVIFWSVLLFGLKGLFNIDLSNEIHVNK
jgi:hypothetical protein